MRWATRDCSECPLLAEIRSSLTVNIQATRIKQSHAIGEALKTSTVVGYLIGLLGPASIAATAFGCAPNSHEISATASCDRRAKIDWSSLRTARAV